MLLKIIQENNEAELVTSSMKIFSKYMKIVQLKVNLGM